MMRLFSDDWQYLGELKSLRFDSGQVAVLRHFGPLAQGQVNAIVDGWHHAFPDGAPYLFIVGEDIEIDKLGIYEYRCPAGHRRIEPRFESLAEYPTVCGAPLENGLHCGENMHLCGEAPELIEMGMK
jgi:hypothetical protein